MPTYRYRCEGCGDEFEVWQSITDDAHTAHDASTGDGSCGGHLVKVLSPAGIVLKGSGFYKTDNRGSQTSSKNGDGSKDAKTPDTSSGSKDGSKDTGSKDSGSKDSGSKSDSSSSSSRSKDASGSKSSSSTSST
jgi:putative FmdB family regulatory protein